MARNRDFIADPSRVTGGENSLGFRAVTAAETAKDDPMPVQGMPGPAMNGAGWQRFPESVDARPKKWSVSGQPDRGPQPKKAR